MNMEEWREIEGYEGLYQVSSYGNIRRNGVVIKPLLRPNGYYQVSLCKNGKRKSHKIHRLVAKAFPEICGEWFDGCEINHKDECKTNNKASNLETCNGVYNRKYGDWENKFVIMHNASLEKCSKPVVVLKDGKYVDVYPSLSDAARKLNICLSLVSNAARKSVTTHGYTIKFKDEVSDTPISSPTPITSPAPCALNKREKICA